MSTSKDFREDEKWINLRKQEHDDEYNKKMNERKEMKQSRKWKDKK